MTGVEAHADARRSVEVLENRPELLESVADRSSLSRRVLKNHHRLSPRPRLERASRRISDQPQRIVGRSARTGAWMQNHAQQAERMRTIDLVDQRADRLLAQGRNVGRVVDQIAAVRHDWRDAGFVDPFP